MGLVDDGTVHGGRELVRHLSVKVIDPNLDERRVTSRGFTHAGA